MSVAKGAMTMQISAPASSADPPPVPPLQKRDLEALKVAREFEAQFISQMLAQAKLTEALSKDAGFGGEAMANMLVNAWAERMTDAGGFGLAPLIAARLEKS
jgi:Rod binding domain-containing protein